MSLSSFSTALSGLNANTEGLSVVGNNIANLNTVGFKESDISFSEVLNEQVATGGGASSVNVGLGTQVQSVTPNFSDGGIQTTNNPLDVAIQGKGFLVVNDKGTQLYTRAGNLHLDANNNLVADNGMNIQGYVLNPSTQLVDPNLGLQNIQLPTGVENPVQTSNFSLSMNLDASAANGTQFTTSVQLYDSTGVSHVATLSLQKQITTGTPPVTQWNFDITIPAKDTAAGGTGNISLLTGTTASSTPNAGSLVFDNSGNLTSAYIGSAPSTLPALANLTIPPTGVTLPAMTNGAALNSKMTWQLLTPTGSPSVTGFADSSSVSASTQNGAAPGSLSNIAINADGTISASFTNGKTISFAQIALAQFGNVGGLAPVNGGLYTQTPASGSAVIGAPGTGGAGGLVGGALEQSNVDLATELTKILTFQRGYQANAKVITATDQLTQTTIQMLQ
jgi:flagellar hook protein FlgE